MFEFKEPTQIKEDALFNYQATGVQYQIKDVYFVFEGLCCSIRLPSRMGESAQNMRFSLAMIFCGIYVLSLSLSWF